MKTTTKVLGLAIAGGIVAAQLAIAAPLVESQVAKDAKWLAHIDMEKLMELSFAELLVGKLKEEIEDSNDSKVSFDVDMLLQEIKSITAYGTTLGDHADIDGVIVVKTGDRIQSMINGFIAQQELSGEGESPFERIEGDPFETFVLDGELYVSFPEIGYIVASKDQDRIKSAYDVIKGNGDSLEDTDSSIVLNRDTGFFFLASATGLDRLKDVPPQARVLQKTKGGQFSVGETDGEMRVNLILATANEEVSMQLYRIIEGMLALASFTQVENQSMMDVVNRVNVSRGSDFVSVDFRYPSEELMKLVSVLAEEHGQYDGHRHEEARSDEHSWRETRIKDVNWGSEEGMEMLVLAAHGFHRDE